MAVREKQILARVIGIKKESVGSHEFSEIIKPQL